VGCIVSYRTILPLLHYLVSISSLYILSLSVYLSSYHCTISSLYVLTLPYLCRYQCCSEWNVGVITQLSVSFGIILVHILLLLDYI